MKVVILAGGFGTRLTEETEIKPKPMVEIGEMPILLHIMKHYLHYGFKEFVIALGYKGEYIKRFFKEYFTLSGNLTIDMKSGRMDTHGIECEDWVVHLIDTGLETRTGGRIKRLESFLKDEPFMVTYGDGVSDVDLHKLIEFHKKQKTIATLTAVRPPARFGGLVFDGNFISEFTEKPQIGEGWINGGFLVFEPEVFQHLRDDMSSLEADAMDRMAKDHQLSAYRHDGFWQCMDTLRDKRLLEKIWQEGKAPWKTWA